MLVLATGTTNKMGYPYSYFRLGRENDAAETQRVIAVTEKVKGEFTLQAGMMTVFLERKYA